MDSDGDSSNLPQRHSTREINSEEIIHHSYTYIGDNQEQEPRTGLLLQSPTMVTGSVSNGLKKGKDISQVLKGYIALCQGKLRQRGANTAELDKDQYRNKDITDKGIEYKGERIQVNDKGIDDKDEEFDEIGECMEDHDKVVEDNDANMDNNDKAIEDALDAQSPNDPVLGTEARTGVKKQSSCGSSLSVLAQQSYTLKTGSLFHYSSRRHITSTPNLHAASKVSNVVNSANPDLIKSKKYQSLFNYSSRRHGTVVSQQARNQKKMPHRGYAQVPVCVLMNKPFTCPRREVWVLRWEDKNTGFPDSTSVSQDDIGKRPVSKQPSRISLC